MIDEISYETVRFGAVTVDVAFRKAQPLDKKIRGIELQTVSKIEFKPGVVTLKKGITFLKKLLEFRTGMVSEPRFSVAITMKPCWN